MVHVRFHGRGFDVPRRVSRVPVAGDLVEFPDTIDFSLYRVEEVVLAAVATEDGDPKPCATVRLSEVRR